MKITTKRELFKFINRVGNKTERGGMGVDGEGYNNGGWLCKVCGLQFAGDYLLGGSYIKQYDHKTWPDMSALEVAIQAVTRHFVKYHPLEWDIVMRE